MTSDRKIESNRKNAKKSTGPRSEAGQRRSRRNALRHGLAVAIGSDPSFSDEVNRLASALVQGRSGQSAGEFALQAAEAEIDLLRIRRLRASLFNSVLGNPEPKLDDHSELNEELAKLERYERRAFSRRKRAFRAMTEAELIPTSQSGFANRSNVEAAPFVAVLATVV
jgi:hypothetical protein